MDISIRSINLKGFFKDIYHFEIVSVNTSVNESKGYFFNEGCFVF